MAFRILKPLIPDTLFGRFLLILALPTVIVQLIATYVFYERHWGSVSRHMSAALAGEVAAVTEMLWQKTPEQRDHILAIMDKNLHVKTWFKEGEELSPQYENSDEIERFPEFRKELRKLMPSPFSITLANDGDDVQLHIQLADGVLHIITTTKRLENQTTYIFILWMTGSAALLLFVALLFSKNQIRAIARLSAAAEKFGKGLEITDFKPEGAKEVRQAAIAFLRMKARIKRQVTKRTEMLAGVSHDLRTPLTRMKLQLAMMGQTEDTVALKADVVEMEKMIQEYLDFVRGEGTESPVPCHVPSFLKGIVSAYQSRSPGIHLEIACDVTMPLRPQAIKRAVTNLLENARRFAKQQVKVTLKEENYTLILTIEDDGPGIPENEYTNVFKPFYRIDRSRNLDTGGVGLGMTISRDIIMSHGGDITLSKSALGGLKVTLSLPL